MGTTQRVFRAVSISLFALSLIVHVLSALRLAPDWGKYPFTLHFGIFVVGIPTIIALVSKYRDRGQVPWLERMWKTPGSLRALTALVFVYTIANFALGASGAFGDPQTDDVAAVRLFSGHWMVFYWMFFLLLRSPL